MVMPADGSEKPVSFIVAETGVKVTDTDGTSVDKEFPKLLIAGQIYSPGIVDYPSDGPTQVWLKDQFSSQMVFNDTY